MSNQTKTGAIIAAAGSGNRMGSGIPKQFRELGGKPLLFWSLQAFSLQMDIEEIVIVTRREWLDFCRDEIVEKYGFHKVKAIVEGGAERQASVKKGLYALSEDIKTVLIHDGARPFPTGSLINRTVLTAKEKGACTAAVAVKDTIKSCENGIFTGTPDRSVLYAVQTPQGFSLELIRRAHEEAEHLNFSGTDDTVLVEKLGEKVYLVEGEYSNIKITTEEDMVTGEAILREREDSVQAAQGLRPFIPRVGTGYDVHAFCEGRPLILGGVEIPHKKGLLGHSDADVLVHTIMDALLGACALGDIGRHFPDSDPAYKGISSMKLLAEVKALMESQSWQVGNLDCVVIAQKPKIAPYIEIMEQNVADVLKISRGQINIKGTTTEKLGFCGREEGIASQAVVTVYKSINR